MTDTKATLRRTHRAARRAVGHAEQEAASRAVDARLAPWIDALRPGIAAATVATDGELSVAPVVVRLRGLGWQIAYPRIADDTMSFHLVDDEADLVLGRWDLLEPVVTAPLVDPHDLDVVLVPLVAFDTDCNRMGRGKAYYDRSFGFLGEASRPARPVLVGVAHDVQQAASVPAAAHDIRLDAVITPSTVHGTLPDP